LFKRIGSYSILVAIFLVLMLFAGCGDGQPAGLGEQGPEQLGEEGGGETVATPAEITVSAAASLTDALEEIKVMYEAESVNTLVMNYGSSGALQQQIEEGAPASIFISAAQKQMNDLQDQGLIDEDSRIDLLENLVVLIVPASDANADIVGFESLGADSLVNLAIGEPESVPAGRYANEILTALELWDGLESNDKLILAKDVRQVLTYVETGNVDAGIVYMTDALTTEKVKVIDSAPVGTHTPVTYPAAIIKDCAEQEAAEDFMAFLQGDKTAAVFDKHGFTFLAGK
jgi:molybdate transport system substrate-binding protein